MSRLRTRAAATGLLGIGALHALWATGSPWPMSDRKELADAVAGLKDSDPPSSAACLAVTGLLGTGAAFVAGHPRRAPALSRIGSAGVVAVLSTRGALGMAGHTDIVSPGSVSKRFRRLDRRFYSPLCLTLAALALPAVSGSAR